MNDPRVGVVASPCPYCARTNDAAVAEDGRDDRPTPGDYSVCFYCAGVAVFSADGVRKPTEAERAELVEDPHVHAAVGDLLVWRGLGP